LITVGTKIVKNKKKTTNFHKQTIHLTIIFNAEAGGGGLWGAFQVGLAWEKEVKNNLREIKN